VCGSGIAPDQSQSYDEIAAEKSSLSFDEGFRMMGWFVGK
jgi:hypothetical protein